MTVFKRTTSGLVAKWAFYDEPLIWVEGPDDIPFYKQILRNRPCRVQPAYGKQECLKLAEALLEGGYPYVVVLDGDYDILKTTRSRHRRVVLLHRHSMENYLFEKEPVERLCCNYANMESDEELVGNAFDAILESLESELMDLVILDVAHYVARTGYQALPDRAECLLKSRKKLTFARDRIAQHCTKCRSGIDRASVDEAAKLVKNFLKKRRFVDLLRGHFVFRLLCDLIINTVREKTGRKPNIDNKGFIVLLSTEVWSIVPSRDHESLRRRLCRALAEVRKIRENQLAGVDKNRMLNA